MSWIKPGQVSWEWWNGATPYGQDVTFKAGCNLETYKYFIDFASKFGIPYIIMDEGWAKSTRDPYTPNPDVDLHELIRYGKEKNVGIVLWLTWLTVEKNFDLFKTFNEWGIKGVKIDFMDRSDQWMVNYYERVAQEAARHHLFVDFHGSFKPAGLEYKYPNVLSYEGVRGMEQMGGCKPENSIYLPFMRNAVGPMDYTPGAMISMQPNIYRSERPNSASIGTRAYQMALFVIFESGLQMLADNPTLYYRNEDCTRFITQVPVTWDETVVLEAKVGEYVIVAKRKGEKWFIGGMTNDKENERELAPVYLISFLTQKMLLMAIYERWNEVKVSDAAKRIGVSTKSASRCFDELEYLNIDVLGMKGKSRVINIPNDRKQVWQQIENVLRNPVIRRFVLREDMKLEKKRH